MTDNAKELLARRIADECERYARRPYRTALDRLSITFNENESPLLVEALRLSARQQASARNLANAILDAPVGSATALARALLAKYDIFEKVEG